MHANERGQAVTETLLLTWILVVFLAAVYQMFVVNESIFRALTASHQLMFIYGSRHNCYDPIPDCVYDSDLHGKVIWRKPEMPEIDIPIVGLFRQTPLGNSIQITSNSPLHADTIKRTKMAAGSYQPPFKTLGWAFSEVGGSGAGTSYWSTTLSTLLNGILTNTP